MKTITKEQLIDKILTQIEETEEFEKKHGIDWNASQERATLYLALSNLIK